MIETKALVEFARTYLTNHPEEITRLAKNVALLRFGLPLDAVRFLVSRARGRKTPKDVVIEAVPPGIRFVGTLELMKTPIRAAVTLFIDRVRLTDAELRFELRLRNLSLEVVGQSDSPIAGLIRSGALDLSKPGNLAAFMPKRPAALVEASDDRIVIDLMKEPKIAAKLGRIAGLVTPLVSIRSIETDAEHLDFYLDCLPDGLSNAIAAVRSSL